MIETNIKVTVTVPIYNTSIYLRQCLDSLKVQTLQDIEFILVDDGSTDDSGAICDNYATLDPRFKVIHKPNGGLASARQTGLDAAKGEYIIVCDSDDWVEPDMYERLYNVAKACDADIAVCGYYAEYNNGRSVPRQTIFKENKEQFIDIVDFMSRGANSSWIKLIKKNLFERTGAAYEQGIDLGEDALICYKLLKCEPKIVQIESNLYHYRRIYGGNTYTNNLKMSHIHQMIYKYEWVKENYPQAEYEPINYQLALNIGCCALRTENVNWAYINGFIKTELKWHRFFNHRLSRKSVIVSLVKLLPYKMVKAAFYILYPCFYK